MSDDELKKKDQQIMELQKRLEMMQMIIGGQTCDIKVLQQQRIELSQEFGRIKSELDALKKEKDKK